MEDKKELLLSYIKNNVAPILVDFVSVTDTLKAVVIPANIKKEELYGHYSDDEYCPPLWYIELLKPNAPKVLVIEKIDSISKEEQVKFCELLKYRKVDTFVLPENCVILVTATNVNKDSISEEVYSLVANI